MTHIPRMPAKFPGVIVRHWGKLEIAEVPAFEMGPYDALCRIEACSICAATDTHLVEGTFPRAFVAAPPFVLGHESAGHVTAIGPKVRNFRPGQLVVRPWWFSGNGDRHRGLGSAWGGFAAWGIVRDSRAIASDTGNSDVWWDSSLVLPEMPPEHATMFVTW